MTVDLNDFTKSVIRTAKIAKKALCKHQGGPADGQPLLIWRNNDGTAIVPLPDLEKGMTRSVMERVYREVWVELGTPEVGAVIVEAFSKEVDNAREFTGDLENDFLFDAEINECITIMVFGRDGAIKSCILKYKYNDNGQPQFIDDTYFMKDGGGEMVEVTTDFLKLLNGI